MSDALLSSVRISCPSETCSLDLSSASVTIDGLVHQVGTVPISCLSAAEKRLTQSIRQLSNHRSACRGSAAAKLHLPVL